MKREVLHTNDAPAAIGPYSQAVRVGPFLYTAGQIAIDPGTGRLIENDIGVQTRQVLRNLSAILAAAGGGLTNVLKTTVFLQDMADFQEMNAVYAEYFTSEPPARSTVAVAGLPLGARVEIEVVAYLPEAAV